MNPGEIESNLAAVRARIAAAGGDPETTLVIAVTKGFGVEAVQAALAVGLDQLGENYGQELVAKADALAAGPTVERQPRWHFVGRLQSNKVGMVAPHVHLWQSVDRRSLVSEIAKRAPGASILVQVDATEEPNKGGCPVADVPTLVGFARDAGLDVRGLMTVGRFGDEEATAMAFGITRDLADRLDLPERSMGMSDDLELAVSAGATMVRVGTALFGPRPAPLEVEH